MFCWKAEREIIPELHTLFRINLQDDPKYTYIFKLISKEFLTNKKQLSLRLQALFLVLTKKVSSNIFTF